MRTLLVMRHAKSDWHAGVSDHERPLNARGERSADAMGVLLARIGQVPRHAICSTARRAADTLERARTAGGWDTTVEQTDDLYETSVAGALAVGTGAPDVPSLLLVGHQPTWSGLVERLTGGSVEVRTATVVGIELPIGSWEQLALAHGSIAFVLQPRHALDLDLGGGD